MSSAFPHILRRWIGLSVALALVVPSLVGVLYHCSESGKMLPAPCAQDDRAHARTARDCCAGDEEAQKTTASSECCEAIDIEQSILPASVVLEKLTPALALLAVAVLDWNEDRADIRTNPARLPPRPPGDPPPFLLHCQFLC